MSSSVLYVFLNLFLVDEMCPDGEQWSGCVECERNCQNIGIICKQSGVGCTAGCICPEGMARHNGRCLAEENCPCFLEKREYQPGEEVPQECNTWYVLPIANFLGLGILPGFFFFLSSASGNKASSSIRKVL